MFGHVKRILDTLSTVLVIVAATVLLWQLYNPRQPQRARPRPAVEDVTTLSVPADLVRHVRGTGSVVLVEFADYECPFCARHTNTTAPMLEQELLEPGKIQQVFLNFPLNSHPRA